MPRRSGPHAIWDADDDAAPLVEATIGGLVDRAAVLFGNSLALVYDDPEVGLDLALNYAELRYEVRRLAKGLLAMGIAKGEHVAIWAPNVPEWVLLELALGMIGAVLVTINPLFRADELRYIIEQGDVTTLFVSPGLGERAALGSLRALPPGLLRREPVIMRGAEAGFHALAAVAAEGESVADADLLGRQASVSPADVAQIQYTSGTTGFPKGAILSHRGIINNARLVAMRAEVQPDDRYITAMPFFHTGGCVIGVLLALCQGVTLHPLVSFDPGRFLRAVERHRITMTCAVPAMLSALLNHPALLAGEVDASSLRLALIGGSPVPVALVEEVKSRIGSDVSIVFGQTEASPIITQTLAGDDFERRSTTVGVPLPHTEVRIVWPGTLEPTLVGETGELLARGYGVMLGYHKMPEQTADAVVDGWLRTGDLAIMDERGYVNIVGRLKDMVIRGGENLYPVEIESVLARHESLAEVQVIGVPDERMGEELCAVVRLRPGALLETNELRGWCSHRMSRQKVPRYVRFVDAYPMTQSGKVKKYELRMRIISELGLQHLLQVRTA